MRLLLRRGSLRWVRSHFGVDIALVGTRLCVVVWVEEFQMRKMVARKARSYKQAIGDDGGGCDVCVDLTKVCFALEGAKILRKILFSFA